MRLDKSIVSAISPGVFCLVAFSTIDIILSINVFPASLVILIFIRSEITFVPPVTELLSPPDSLITGADSPVTADSSTKAIPSITSPSPGIISLASQRTMSPFFKSVRFIFSMFPDSVIFFAITFFLMRLSESALALP